MYTPYVYTIITKIILFKINFDLNLAGYCTINTNIYPEKISTKSDRVT